VLGPTGLAALMVPSTDAPTLAAESMAFLAATVLCAILGGLWPAVAAALLSTGLLNWFYTDPRNTLFIDRTADLVLLALFLLVAVAVSSVVGQAARRTAQASEARREADALIELNRAVLRSEQDLETLLELVRHLFSAEAVSLLRPTRTAYELVGAVGDSPPGTPSAADEVTEVKPSTEPLVLALRGVQLTASDRRVLTSFAGHLAVALERRDLAARAARTHRLEEGNRVRNALLTAVSHDLRTPLARTKVAVSSLRSPDVQWSDADRRELLATIEDSTDRLHAIVTNLLDLSRIQTDAVTPAVQEVGLEDVVSRALHHATEADRVQIEIAPDVPQVRTDVGLLERVLANLLDNAVRHAPSDEPVGVSITSENGHVQVRVVDHGPGVPGDKEQIFTAFRRLGDSSSREGLGLGLAVARGLTEAVGGQLIAEDTPGGGLTMVVDLPSTVSARENEARRR
jgi:two-component system, OmpR family, sensor histidine kinase KdpD